MTIARPIPASYWLNDGTLPFRSIPAPMIPPRRDRSWRSSSTPASARFVNPTESSEPLTTYDDVLHDLSEERSSR
jgi:hypothetical protein